jgi:hypothetical protein
MTAPALPDPRAEAPARGLPAGATHPALRELPALPGTPARQSRAATRPAAALDAALLAAHAAGDAPRLVSLYLEAGDMAETECRPDAACFYLTQAYVFALETGDARAGALHARLVRHGREE